MPAHLIDGPADLQPAWFDGVNTVLVTAGASAPEQVVEDCLDMAPRAIQRDDRAALDPPGKRVVPAAAGAKKSGHNEVKFATCIPHNAQWSSVGC